MCDCLFLLLLCLLQAATLSAQHSGGAIQRSSTSAVALDQLSTDSNPPLPPELDSDDEAIFADFEASHLTAGSSSSQAGSSRSTHTTNGGGSTLSEGGVGSSSSGSKPKSKGSKLVAAFRGRSSSSLKHVHMQEPVQPAQHEGVNNRVSAPSGHAAAAADSGPHLHRSRSASSRSVSAPGHRQDGSDGGVSPGVVPGVAVARIQGCWLSHLNIDNQR